MKLYVYEHCPYCIKARMIFGLKNVPVEINYFLNDDVDGPTNMIGSKMVPILQKEDGSYMPESMDIVHYINELEGESVFVGEQNEAIAAWLAEARSYVYKLAMPRWVRSSMPEFETQGARDFFTTKKEGMIGSFDELLADSDSYITEAEEHLQQLEPLIQSENAVNGSLSEDDIHLFATLHSLSIVKGLNFPAKVAGYAKAMSKFSNVALSTVFAN